MVTSEWFMSFPKSRWDVIAGVVAAAIHHALAITSHVDYPFL
jgi:adenine/guanine phosphoribosyltransferase-like PRPP-binding protein